MWNLCLKSSLRANLTRTMSTFYRVCVEGNIGCGKSSVLNHLAKRGGFLPEDLKQWNFRRVGDNLDMVISPEPLDRWTNIEPESDNLLELMYTDPKRWGFAFENYAQFTRYEQMKKVFGKHQQENQKLGVNTLHILERSIFSNRFCFIENFYRSEKLAKIEYAMLDEWFKYLIDMPDNRIDKFIYLQTSPEVIFERVKKRARSEDEIIPLSYLEDIHKHHEFLFTKSDPKAWQFLEKPLPEVIIIDATQPLTKVCEEIEKHVFNIKF